MYKLEHRRLHFSEAVGVGFALTDTLGHGGSSEKYIAGCMLTTTKAITLFSDSWGTVAQVIDISGDTLSNGTKAQISANAFSSYSSICRLTDSTALAIYADSNSDLYGCVLSVSGTTITPGTEREITSENATDMFVCALSTTKVLVSYIYSTLQIRVIDISGDVLSMGSPVQVFAGGASMGPAPIEMIDSSTAIIFYGQTSGGARVVTVSGDTPTLQTAVTFVSSGAPMGINSCKLSSTKFAIAYANNSDIQDWYCLFTVSGNTVTAGTEIKFYAAYNTVIGIGAFSEDYLLISTQAKFWMYGVDGTTLSEVSTLTSTPTIKDSFYAKPHMERVSDGRILRFYAVYSNSLASTMMLDSTGISY